MKHIGNIPLEIVQQNGRWDYVQAGNPALDVNPGEDYATWLNATTGEEFICIDRSSGANKWIGQASTVPYGYVDMVSVDNINFIQTFLAFPQILSEITVEGLVYLSAPIAADGVLFEHHDYPSGQYGYQISVTAGNGLSFYSSKDSTTWANPLLSPAGILEVGTVYRLSFTIGGGFKKIYVDGVEVATVSWTGLSAPTDHPFAVGFRRYRDYYDWKLLGASIGDIRIWDHARSQVDIDRDKWRVLTGAEAGLVANYQGGDGPVSVMVNRASSGDNHLNLDGATRDLRPLPT
jgi:hypothetical protein